MLAFWFEKPPIETVLNTWISESKIGSPRSLRIRNNMMDKTRYIVHRCFAVSAMRGVSFSAAGPGASMFISCIPPTESLGRIAIARIKIPIPPSHCVKLLQKSIP